MIPRTLLPLLVCLFAHVLSVSSSPLVVERAAATCAAKDIATVKRTVADPVYFCQWWQQDVRTRSPFMEFSATQVDTLCKCISPVATGPKCKRKRKRSQIEERSALVARSAASCSAEVSAQFTQPYRFCTFYTAYPRTTSPFRKYTASALTKADNIYNQETGDLYDQEAHIDQYAEAYINKHEEAYLDKHKETHLDKHKEIYLDEHDEACIDQHEEGYNYDINEREASHIGKLKEAHDNHDEASNNQSQGFNFKHQESFNNQLKEMSKEFVCLGVNGVGTRWVLGTIGVQMNLDIGTKMQELCRIFFH
ncbi:hypothetical protein D6C87_09081 [Aureobasidium pullulans]|nr:hypothetical protein D6C87_09081 [Aureobasidium pullulans]